MRSCLNCIFAHKCSHCRDTAYRVCFKVKRTQQMFAFFEAAASSCESFSPVVPKKRVKQGTQLSFNF